jgi:gliding motility-associated-like protein
LIWNFGDGSSEVTNDATPTHLFPGPGEYDVTLTAINSALGCPDIAQTTVVVQEASPALLFQSSEGCPPVAVAISNTIDNVYWNIQISNGDSLIMQRSIATGVWTARYYAGEQLTTLITANGQNHWPQLTFSEAGCYDFEVYSTDANGCNSTHTYHDVVCVGTDSNFGNFQTTVVSACDPFEVEFNTTVSGISSWMWTFSDGSQATGNPVSHTFLPPFSPNAPLSATLTAVNTGGCTSMVTQPIVAAMPITPSFHTSGSPVCKNEEISFTNTTTGSAISFTWSFGDGQTGTGTNAVHSYSQNGIYEVCLTADNGAGCLQTTCTMAGATVASPEASFTHTSSITNCLFGVNFENTSQGAIDELMWIFGDGQTGSVNETYHTYSIGVYNVMLVASNQFGCVDTSVVIDIFNYGDIIGPYTALLDTTPCAPFGVDFSAFNPSDNYFTYFWDFNDGSGDPTGATQTQHDYLEPGVYCPSVILTDPDGCQMFISCEEPIVVEEFITTNLYEPSICAGETTLFTATGADHYVWNTSPFISAAGTSNTFVLTPPTSTSFLLTSTLDDCVRVDTIHVQVNPLPAVSLSMPDFVCYSAPDIALTTGLPVGTSGYYTVNGEVSTFFNTNQLPNAAYEVSYTFSDSLGCTNTSTEEVWIAPLPVITFSTFEGICANESALLLEHAAPAGGVYTFQADTISYFDPSGHLGLQALNYHFTDANGCSNSESFTIPVYAAPVPVVSIPSVCEDLPFVAFSASTLAEGTITSTEWQLDGGAWTNDNPFTPTFTPAVGLHSIRLRLESDMGCISESDSTFSVWPIPEPSFATENGCQFSSLPLVANSTVVSGEIERYLWLVEGETYEDDDSLDYEFQTWGTQSVSLINITENGCDDTLSLTMMVYPAPVIDLVVENACEGAITYLDSQVSLPLGGIVQHIWNLGDGTTEPSMPAIDHIFSENGTYTISYTAQSNLNCTSTSTTELIIHDTPEVDFAIIDSTVCVETELELVDMSSVDPLQEITHWNWYLDDLQLSTTQNPVVDYPLVGHYSLRLEVFTNNGCTADSIQPYAVFIMPKPEAGMRVVRDELTMSAPVVDIKNESSLDVSSWYYTLGDGTTATSEDVRHAYSSWGNYSISQIVTNAFGCTDTTTDRVSVDSEVLVYVPNAFTPDGNGNNDGFKPVLSGFEIDMYFLKIVNRWGQVVFETKDPELYWNGDYNNVGAQALDGAYTWQLDLKTTDSPVIQRQAGTVVLLR